MRIPGTATKHLNTKTMDSSVLNVDAQQCKQIFMIEKLAGMDLVVPDIQRSLDTIRVQNIIEYQKHHFQTHGTFCFMGELTLYKVGEGGNGMLLIDGQHRYAAMKTTYMLKPDYKVCVNIVSPGNGMTIEKAFLLLNMSKPVPEYVINTTMQHTKRVYLENARMAINKDFKNYVSSAPNPRAPNINAERIVADLLVTGLADKFQTVETLMGYVKFANMRLSAADLKVRKLALEKADKYGMNMAVYLSADPENKWMTNALWITEYTDSLMAIKMPYRGHIKVIPRKRQALPKAIRDLLWKGHFTNNPTGLCKCCGTNTIEYTTFHAGHVVSKAKGGSDELSNLLPTCSPCNLGMGAMNMVDFQAKFGINGGPPIAIDMMVD